MSAYIFWTLTVRIKDWLKRRKYRWWIYDQQHQLIAIERDIETQIGYDKLFSQNDLKERLLHTNEHETLSKDILAKLNSLVDKALQLVNLNFPWNDDEIDCFADIYNICFMIRDEIGVIVLEEQISKLYKEIKNLAIATDRLEKHVKI